MRINTDYVVTNEESMRKFIIDFTIDLVYFVLFVSKRASFYGLLDDVMLCYDTVTIGKGRRVETENSFLRYF